MANTPLTKLSVSVSSLTSEVAKEAVLRAADISKGAAEVIRDANGRVTEVRITLPTTTADAAAAAIAATPGVANVASAPVLPPIAEIDGSDATVFDGSGWLITKTGTWAITSDGQVASCTPTIGSAQYGFLGITDSLPNFSPDSQGTVMETRMKCLSNQMSINKQDGIVRLDMYNGAQRVNLTLYAQEGNQGGQQLGSGVSPVPTFFDGEFHVLKLVAFPNLGGQQVWYDGVLIGHAASLAVISAPRFDLGMENVDKGTFGHLTDNQNIYSIDYISWSQPA